MPIVLDNAAEAATAVLITRKPNAQFQDRPGACKLLETAATRGDQAITHRLAECRAN